MERDQLRYLGVDGKIILKYSYKKWNAEEWTASIWLRIGTVGGLL